MTHRTVARRAFVDELRAATYTFQEREADKAPVWVLLPTGCRLNRTLITGTITRTEVAEDGRWALGRLADPTGTITIEAGQFEPDHVKSAFSAISPPEVASVSGKLRVEQDDGSFESKIRVDELALTSETARDRWILDTAEQTLARLRDEQGKRENTARAEKVYSYDLSRFRDTAVDALHKIERQNSS